ncbi:MAG: PfkB family carbohydrate kinase [Burkholderiales bacterium]
MAQPPTTASVRERLTAARIIPVLRFDSRREAEHSIDCLLEAGFATVEVTLTTPDAVALIAALRKRLDESFLVGATGAGDCFAGTLMARLAAGENLWAALEYANAAAALACTGFGAVGPLPSPEKVRALMARR